MIKAILFDVDGTLSETEEIHRKSFNRAFAVHGLTWHWSQDQYRKLLDVSGGKERIRYYLSAHPDNFLLINNVNQFVRSVHETKTGIYTQLVQDGAAELRPGIRGLIAATIRFGIRRAIATTTSLPNVEALLGAAYGREGMGLFETICAGDSVPDKKPAPDIYLATLKEMKLRPDQCIAIEDSRNGLVAATAAGIPTVITPGIYTTEQRFDEAMLVTTDLQASLQEILNEATVPAGLLQG
jgi:beta-phosphoglucomutase-like phosphatase (HAD superfamily)